MEGRAGGGDHVKIYSGTCTAELGTVSHARVGAVAFRSAGAAKFVAAVALGIESG
jgi:hypothetical protein